MAGIRIIGTGSFPGDKIVTNSDMERIVDTSDQWIVSKTGIRSRYFADKLTNADMAYEAAVKALDDAKITAEDISVCIVCTFTPDDHTPGVSCQVAGKLGIQENALSFDLNGACSGFIYGCVTAEGILSSRGGGYALVIGSEKISPLINMQDRSTCVLFGDGAGAAVVEYDKDAKFVYHTGCVPDRDVLGCDGKSHHITMEGQEVYRFAVSKASFSIAQLMKTGDISDDDIDYYVCHQANERIIDNIARRVSKKTDKFFKNLYGYGNTSAASIPIALAEMNEKSLLGERSRLLCSGFGAGLTYASLYVEYHKKGKKYEDK